MINKRRLVDMFTHLVKIESITFNERQVADYIGDLLASIGVEYEEDGSARQLNGSCGNIIARIPGRNDSPTILLAAHMDTVEPGVNIEPVIEKGTIRSSGKTVLGADDKAGCAVIIEVLTSIMQDSIDHSPLEIVFTAAEEKGLLGSRNLDMAQFSASFGFVIDGDGPVGAIVIKAPYQDYFKAVFKGKAAHAGVEPEKGISAIKAAAYAVSNMKTGRIDSETTANIGVIKGGRAINTVAEETIIEGEARSHDISKLKQQVENMRECVSDANKTVGTIAAIRIDRLYDGFSLSEDEDVVKIAKKVIRDKGIEPRLIASGGGSDTNIFNKGGIKTLNLSCGAEKVHTTSEHISIDDMVKAATILESVLILTSEEML